MSAFPLRVVRPVSYGAVLVTALILVVGCRSTKPPPPEPQPVTTARRATTQAEKYSADENWSAAARQWKTAADRLALLNDEAGAAIAWHNEAQAQAHLGSYTEAHRLLEKAAEVNAKLGERQEWWRNQLTLLQVEAQSQQTARLKDRIEALAPLTGELKDKSLLGTFQNELGLWQKSQKEMSKAAESFRLAAQNFQAAKDEVGVATVRANEAELAEALQEYDRAIQTWRIALEKFEALADPEGITASLLGLGRANLLAKNFPAAEDYLRRATHNFKTLKAEKKVAETTELLREALKRQGEPEEPNVGTRSD